MMALEDVFCEERQLVANPDDVAAAMRRYRQRQRRLPGLVYPAAIAAAVAVVLVISTFAGAGSKVDAQAADIFSQAASVTAQQPTLADLKPGQFLYTKATSTSDETTTATSVTFTILVTRTTQTWMRSDYSGRVRSVLDGWAFRTPADRRAWIDAGRPPVPDEPRVASRAFSRAEGRSMVAAPGYATSPAALYTQLHDQATHGPWPMGAEMFVLIKDVLRESADNPALRAAALQVAARAPCAHVLGIARDDTGRQGTIVGCKSTYWGGPLIDEFLFDTKTGALLAERQVRPTSTGPELRWQATPVTQIVYSSRR